MLTNEQNISLEEVFLEYEILVNQVDSLFVKVQNQYPKEVLCLEGCSDCCHALFDLSLVEAMSINRAFTERFGFGPTRSTILVAADEADRQLTKLKKEYHRELQQGISDEEILKSVSKGRIRCPLLDDNNLCMMYDVRPLTCRIYGVPTAIHGKAHVCGKCAFPVGEKLPTVHLDRIQDKLANLSRKLALAVGSRFRELHHVYIPISMALITKYDDAYLGTGKPSKEQ